MVSYQYPDTVSILKKPVYEQDANGKFKPVGEGSTFTSDCRAEESGSNPLVIGDDGNQVIYSWVIYMPKTSEVLAFGDDVTLTRGDGSIHKSTLKRQRNGKFNSRLWV